jgi:type IV secretion system protein VirD4
MSEVRAGHDPLLIVAGAAAAAVGVVWAGAQAASLLVGHGTLALGADAAVRAVALLPRYLNDPADAWPAAAAAQLPGPVAYWLATGAISLAMIGLFGWLWARMAQRPGPERRRRLGVDTEARLATSRDVAPLVVPSALPGRFVLGNVGRHLVATEDRRGSPARGRRARSRQGDRSAVAVIGPARCGKTANTISGILEWEGPAILSSVKSDLLGATLARRQAVGEVKVFDPTGSTGLTTAGWSPLRAAGTLTGAQKAARALVDTGPKGGAENLEFFASMAEQLLWPLLFAAAAVGRTMTDVVRWVMGQDRPLDGSPGEVMAVLDALLVAGDPARRAEASFAMSALESTWLLDDRTRGGAYATAKTLLRAWEDPTVAASAGSQDVDLEWLLSGPNTLYVCAPMHEQARLAPVFGGLLGDLLQQSYERANLTGEPLPNLLLVMDEAGNTPAAWLPSVASTCASIGILLVTVWQSVAQINAAYGRLADSVLTNHGTKIIFSGVSDSATLDYAARLLGHEEVLQHALSADYASPRRSVNESTARRELVPADVLRRVAPYQALLLHGTLHPAHLRARPYYLDRRLRRLAAA